MNIKPLLAAGMLMGIGMGGFVDGILFHQIFQLHSMLSAKLPQTSVENIEISMVWDGLFHLLTWLTTASSIFLLWHTVKRPETPWSGAALFGAQLAGWGIFNLVEGIIDHHVLQIHHVVERLGLSIYDYLFLASGVLFILIGLLIVQQAVKNITKQPIVRTAMKLKEPQN